MPAAHAVRQGSTPSFAVGVKTRPLRDGIDVYLSVCATGEDDLAVRRMSSLFGWAGPSIADQGYVLASC